MPLKMQSLFTFYPIDLGSAIIGSIAGFIFACGLYYFDKSIKPGIEVKVGNPSKLLLDQGEFKSLNLKVINKKRNGFFTIFNKPATQIKIFLYFSDFQSRIAINTIVARWNSSREPLTPNNKEVDVGLALTHPREVLVPGEESEISVAIKKRNINYCLPFSNESYIYQNKDFEVPTWWKIRDDKFFVTVRFQSAEMEKMAGVFVVINKNNLEQFKIEKL
jgi:hypothetical protein